CGTDARRPHRHFRHRRPPSRCGHTGRDRRGAPLRPRRRHAGSSRGAAAMNKPARMELVCPAGTPATLRAAVEAGAGAVYCGFRDETNARNFPGLNFSDAELAEGVRFAHDHGTKVLVAINTFARVGEVDRWRRAADTAVACSADAIIAGD